MTRAEAARDYVRHRRSCKSLVDLRADDCDCGLKEWVAARVKTRTT